MISVKPDRMSVYLPSTQYNLVGLRKMSQVVVIPSYDNKKVKEVAEDKSELDYDKTVKEVAEDESELDEGIYSRCSSMYSTYSR